jgi:hypothetical protein
MRAEGVLRLILNVALFPGMTCEITGDKYLKTVVLESGELKSFLIKVSWRLWGVGFGISFDSMRLLTHYALPLSVSS